MVLTGERPLEPADLPALLFPDHIEERGDWKIHTALQKTFNTFKAASAL